MRYPISPYIDPLRDHVGYLIPPLPTNQQQDSHKARPGSCPKAFFRVRAQLRSSRHQRSSGLESWALGPKWVVRVPCARKAIGCYTELRLSQLRRRRNGVAWLSDRSSATTCRDSKKCNCCQAVPSAEREIRLRGRGLSCRTLWILPSTHWLMPESTSNLDSDSAGLLTAPRTPEQVNTFRFRRNVGAGLYAPTSSVLARRFLKISGQLVRR